MFNLLEIKDFLAYMCKATNKQLLYNNAIKIQLENL